MATRDGLKASLQLLKAPPRADELKAQESAIEQAKLASEKAQAAVDRLRPLLEKQQIPPAQLYEAELAAAQAKLQREAAEAQLQVLKLGPRVEAVEEAQSRIYTADATLDSAQLQLNLFTLKSPIDGVLDSLTCRLGQTLSPGMAIGESRRLTATEGRRLASHARLRSREGRAGRRGCRQCSIRRSCGGSGGRR